jgi:hypothetical protein
MDFICNSINGMHLSNSKFWQKLRQIETANGQTHQRNPSLVVNKQVVYTLGEKCNIFADNLEQVLTDNEDPEFDASFKRKATDATASSIIVHHFSASYLSAYIHTVYMHLTCICYFF